MKPVVYSRFSVTRGDGERVKLRIQEIRPHEVDKIITFVETVFAPENPFIIATGLLDHAEGLAENLDVVRMLFTSKMIGLVCYEDQDDSDDLKVVGCNVLRMSRKDDQPPRLKYGPSNKCLEFNAIQKETYDTLKEMKVDECLSGVVLGTDPAYRRCGIATELLKTRLPLMERHGIAVTDAWFLPLAGQITAAKAGYKVAAELEYAELTRRTGVHFSNVPPTLKLMYLVSSHYKQNKK